MDHLTQAEFGWGHIRCPSTASSQQLEEFINGCGMVWNTLATRQRCPDCGHCWRWTACPRYRTWSPHSGWYAREASG